MHLENRNLIETLAVVGMDPTLQPFCPECMQFPKVVRQEMAYQSRNYELGPS